MGPAPATPETTSDALRKARVELAQWLRDAAYPLWFTRGIDRAGGGFHERLNPDGQPLNEPRRVRVQPRQVYAFAHARGFGWGGDAASAMTIGMDYLVARYRRSDGFYRTLVAARGTSLDDQVFLYDQAFVLLGLAECHRVLGSGSDYVNEAVGLRTLIYGVLKRPGPGFDSGLPARLPLLANPHMHLFEASLAWIAAGGDDTWRALAHDIVLLAIAHLIDPQLGAVREAFDARWHPEAGIAGRIIEPGHQFEWAWLLLRWSEAGHADVRPVALRLMDFAEQHGVREGVALNSILDDGQVHDGTARLWAQTERLKAAMLAARITGEARYGSMAESAVRTLGRFLETPTRGLWYDRLTPDNEFVSEPAPASSFYHIVAAMRELATRETGTGTWITGDL